MHYIRAYFNMFLQDLLVSLTDLVYPRVCPSCDISLPPGTTDICLSCRIKLPFTDFHTYPDNPVARAFWGKVPVEAATSLLHFQKGGRVQEIMHQLKYRHRQDLGEMMGKLLARQLKGHPVFDTIDHVIPVPLHPRKQHLRGYNQSEAVARGFCMVHPASMVKALRRNRFTATQTKKNRWQRWKNVEGKFSVRTDMNLDHTHVLLIDDVLTTGATMESCIVSLHSGYRVKVSVATVAYAE